MSDDTKKLGLEALAGIGLIISIIVFLGNKK